MKKMLGLVILFSCALLWGDPGFVYKDNDTLLKGQPWMGSEVEGGVLISAEQALSSPGSLIVGEMDGSLSQGSIHKLDNELNVALIKVGKPLTDPLLIKKHKERIHDLKTFLPASSGAFSGGASDSSSESHSSDEMFLIKINDQIYAGDPIELPVKRKKSEFKFELVNVSTESVWRVDVRLKSEPRLSFFKKGRKKGLNDIHRPVLKYHYQSMFKKFQPGKSFKFSVEVSHIKKETYEWMVTLKSDLGLVIRKIPIKFVKK